MSYKVKIHHPEKLILIPNMRVDGSGCYKPSDYLSSQIEHMWKIRKPREVGLVSELVAEEVIDGSQMEIDGTRWPIYCESFKTFAASNKFSLKPEFGIRSDDLISIVTIDKGYRLIFVTECKGTLQKKGFPHSVEAKIFYQLPRTVKMLKLELTESKNMSFGGLFHSKSIIMPGRSSLTCWIRTLLSVLQCPMRGCTKTSFPKAR